MSSISLDTISSHAVNLCNYVYENLCSLASRITNLFKDLSDWISSWFTDQNKHLELKKTVTSSITPEKTVISTKMFLDFYRGTGTDIEGRTFDEILNFDDNALEDTHDFIQWLFPNRTPSQFNPKAPLLNDKIIEAFKTEDILQTNLSKAFTRMLKFYGFGFNQHDFANNAGILKDRYVHTVNQKRVIERIKPGDHNLLRITRILSCMSDLGFPQKGLLITLRSLFSNGETKGMIPNETLSIWEATTPDPINEETLELKKSVTPPTTDQLKAYEIVKKAIPLIAADIKRETQLTMKLLGTKSIGASEWTIDLSKKPEPKITEEQIKKLLEENPLVRNLTILIDSNLKESWSPDFKAIDQHFQASSISTTYLCEEPKLLIQYRRKCDSLESAINPAEQLLKFYRGQGTNNAGETFDQILKKENKTFEDYKWLFPISNPPFPFTEEKILQENLTRAYINVLKSYGVKIYIDDPLLKNQSYPIFKKDQLKIDKWLENFASNSPHITQILTCLPLSGFLRPAQSLFFFLEDLKEGKGIIPKVTIDAWNKSLFAFKQI